MLSVLVIDMLLRPASADQAKLDEAKVIEDLRSRYRDPFPSMYLTNTALSDLTSHLADDEKKQKIKEDGVSAEAIATFAKFLSDVQPSRGVFQIDLTGLKAGHKRRDENTTGLLSPLAWPPRTTIQIAYVCDKYFRGMWQWQAFAQSLKAGTRSLKESWTELAALNENPYVPVSSLSKAAADFAAFVEQRPAEVRQLAAQDTAAYGEIMKFKNEFATYKTRIAKGDPAQFETWVTDVRAAPIASWRSTTLDQAALHSYLSAKGTPGSTVSVKTQALEGAHVNALWDILGAEPSASAYAQLRDGPKCRFSGGKVLICQ
jgi:hypothetical protein